MARGRFLSRDVSTSEKLADLPSHFARVLWSWMIPHADRDGRLDGRARKVKALAVPMLDEGISDVEAALEALAAAELVVRYTDASGQAVVEIVDFAEHQQGMRYEREQPSKYGPNPAATGDTSGNPPEDGGHTPATSPTTPAPAPEASRPREGKLSQDQGKGREGPPNTALSLVPISDADPRAAAVAAVLSTDRYGRDIDHDLVAWATSALGTMGNRLGETTPEQCADAVRARLPQLGDSMPLEQRRRIITNALRYLPENLRKRRDEVRTADDAEADPERRYGPRGAKQPKLAADRVLTPEQQAEADSARKKFMAELPNIGGGGA